MNQPDLTPEQRLVAHLATGFIEQQVRAVLPSLELFRVESRAEGDSVRLTLSAAHAGHTLVSRALLAPKDSTPTIHSKAADMAYAMLRILRKLRTHLDDQSVEAA